MAKSVRQIPGVFVAEVNFASGTLVVEYDRAVDPRRRVEATVRGAGHVAVPLGAEARQATPVSWWVAHKGEVAVAASGLLIVAAWAFAAIGAATVSSACYAAAIVVGGTITWRRAAVSLAARTLDMNVLMTIAVAGAAALGEWGEGATVIFLFALGGVLESRSLSRTRQSIRQLLELAPPTARVLRAGKETEVPPGDVRVGETIVVRPGERVPLDGAIVEGSSAFDESPITGESLPVDKAVGDEVFAGTLNASGAVRVRVTSPAGESMLARIVELVETAQASRAPVERFIDRFSRRYTPSMIALAVAVAVVVPALGALGAPWAGFEAWRDWVYRSLVLLVISCPCALVVSTPVAVVSAIARAARDGVLIKGGAFLEIASGATVVAFDKTGTLTEGRPRVAEVVPLGDEAPDRLLALAAALEQHSNHPLARAVAAAADPSSVPRAREVREVAGRGVTGLVEGVRLAVGGVVFAEERGGLADEARSAVENLEAAGLTVLVLMREEVGARSVATGLLGLEDAIRPEAPLAVRRLAEAGVEHLVMLTGDNERAAARVAGSAGVTEWRARLLPEGKTAAVVELREAYGPVVMVGDGINDAPALAAADVGIAMGAAGSDTAIETADVALMRDDLTAVSRFVVLGRRTMRTVRQNIALSLGIKALVLVLAAAGAASLWMAVFADTGVALIVIANGLRLLRARA